MRTGIKILSLIGLSAIGSVVNSLLGSSSALAAVTQPSVVMTIGSPVGSQTLTPTSTSPTARANYQVPVTFDLDHVDTLQVTVRTTGDGNLTNTNGGVIAPVASTGASLSTLANAWGYRWVMGSGIANNTNFGDSLYKPVSTAGTVVYNEAIDYDTADGAYTETVKNKVLTLDFAAAVDDTKPSGNYSATVEVSAVAMPKTIAFYTITYMNEMTDAVCDSVPTPSASLQTQVAGETVDRTAEGLGVGIYDTDGWRNAVAANATDAPYVPQTTLIDQRDGKTYLVRKLADGNCWMAQNLELDLLGVGQKYATAKTSDATTYEQADANYFGTIAGAISFSSDTTDLPTGVNTWTWNGTTINTTGSSSDTINTTVYATSVFSQESSTPEYGWKDDGSDGLRSYSYPGTAVACATAGTINTAVADAGDDAAVCPSSTADWNYSKLQTPGTDSKNATYTSSATGEAYERYGNLYNWTAATLGYSIESGADTDGQTVSGSICPKGWTLPTNEGEKSWVSLLSTYEVTNANVASIMAYNKMPNAPLNFLRTGNYGRSYGRIDGRLTYGRWWSNAAGSVTDAYNLETWSSNVDPQRSYYRGRGIAIRCVAR